MQYHAPRRAVFSGGKAPDLLQNHTPVRSDVKTPVAAEVRRPDMLLFSL
jgi:hypothetical protein